MKYWDFYGLRGRFRDGFGIFDDGTRGAEAANLGEALFGGLANGDEVALKALEGVDDAVGIAERRLGEVSLLVRGLDYGGIPELFLEGGDGRARGNGRGD